MILMIQSYWSPDTKKEEKIIDELVSSKEEKVTILEKWINKGIEQGLQQGLQQGLAQGLRKGEIKGKILILKELGFSDEDIAKKLNISKEEINEYLK